MTPKRDSDLNVSSGAYALGSLSGPEKAEFEALMAVSESLRAEVTELSDTAVELGLSVAPEAPSAEFRSNLLALIAQTPQFSPGEVDTSDVVPAVVPIVAPVTAAATAPPTAKAGGAESRAQARWFQRPIGTLVAAAAAVALIVGVGFGANVVMQAQGDMATASQINEIQAADDYDRASVDVAGGGSATLVWSVDLKRSALIVDGMEGLPAGSTYELWYLDGSGEARPAGTFDVGNSGSHTVVLDGDMSADDGVAVTIERSGGSDNDKPTTDPIVVFSA